MQVASNGFTFDQLGIRIPTIAISPWIAKGMYAACALMGLIVLPKFVTAIKRNCSEVAKWGLLSSTSK